jgi:hypothetical protein
MLWAPVSTLAFMIAGLAGLMAGMAHRDRAGSFCMGVASGILCFWGGGLLLLSVAAVF